ncbi:uncharacterized protein BcabD6B2_07670 [Babesia caballi]|uniref:Uncharacterized protein n=1 Tax=Babesia caballi TaxID=5871 RepID=A0AAV4LP04_BABCB|nr:hypothetical protein, conserved [Babesia caballi]
MVAMLQYELKGVYEKICEKFCNISDTLDGRPAPVLKYYLKNLETFESVKRSSAETDEEILMRLKGESRTFTSSISTLAKNLKTFLGATADGLTSFNGTGIIKNSGANYNPAYQNAEWKSEEATECLIILLTVAAILFFGLSYLYWQCEGQDGWATKSPSQDDFKQFLVVFGYTESDLNNSKKGQQITTQLQSACSQLQTHKSTASSESYHNFLTALHKTALNSQPPSPTTSPLTSLYALSYYYITNFLYTVESSSPAMPSFAGYSGVTALAGGAYGFNLGGLGTFEAIDWILRVTGKDGQDQGGSSSGNATKLAKAITEFHDLNMAITAAAEKLTEKEGVDVRPALEYLQNEETLKGIIKKLGDGLRAFIGYGSNNGIADVIDPLQQLRKGVLMFLQMMLERFRDSIDNDSGISTAVGNAIKNTEQFDEAIGKVGGLQENNSGTGSQVKEVVSALKNIGSLQSKSDVNELANGFKEYLKEVLSAVKNKVNGKAGQIETLKSNLDKLLDAFGNQSDFATYKTQVKETNNQLYSQRNLSYPASTLVPAVTTATENFLGQLKTGGYKSSYDPTPNWDGDHDNDKIAQILFGCLPLYYYWLTYLYWKCKQPQKEGGWENMAFSGRGGGFALKHFIVGQGYNATHLTTNRGFKGSNIAMLIQSLGISATATQHSHPDFLSQLNKSLKGVIGTGGLSTANLDGHSLSALFHLCRCYFTGKQIMQSNNPSIKCRPPKSIREMLYWLSGLQFSPHYSDIEKQIEKNIPNHGLPVADSSTSSPDNVITQSQMTGFLLSSCLSAPGVLGAIQGNSADYTYDKGEPWLYHLFCNGLNLAYPSSGSALFNTLANYAYALQFQLLFLYMQCRTNYNQTYGWQWCRYGQGVGSSSGNNSGELASWICSASNCPSFSCQHNSPSCNHFQKCGQSDKHSPLQAFLTDNLKGFHVAQQPDPLSPHHLDNHSPGSMCHVLMGFDGTLTKDANATGWYIYYLLEHFCSNSKTPLRQLCEKLGCLTKRTPRTLGDLFGFLWHLNGQLFKDAHVIYGFKTAVKQKPYNVEDFITNFKTAIRSHTSQSSSGKSRIVESFESMGQTIPFLYQLYTIEESNSVPDALFDLTYHCHRKETGHSGNSTRLVHKDHSGRPCSTANDLWSLYQPVSNTGNNSDCKSGTCGGYLSPLTHTYGAAYSPKFASTYLSWVVYLVEVFNERLGELLTEFNNTSCDHCNTNCSCTKGQHGTTNCSCHSVVSCAGVLPLLYSNGFSFGNAYSLKGGTHGADPMKRNCQQFHDQLSAVIAQNESAPLFKLLTTIDEFLYLFRFYFFYNLSTFWITHRTIHHSDIEISKAINTDLHRDHPPKGYCPSNLKEAIDWILRVTGKDGGGGGTNDLAGEVKKLLESVENSGTGLGKEMDNVKEALGTHPNGLIAKLADGLRQFIGYDKSGKLTGGGIRAANVAKYQVCNAVLNFVIRLLEGLCVIKELASHNEKVSEVIGKLRNCVGTGQVPKGFKDLADGIKQKVKDIDQRLKNNQYKLHDAFQNFNTLIDTLKYEQNMSLSVTQDSEQVKSFLDTVNKSVRANGSGNFRNLCDSLNELFKEGELKKSASSLSNSMQLNSSRLSNKTTPVSTHAGHPGLSGHIDKLTNKLNMPANAAVFTAVRDAATAFLAELQAKTYTSYYYDAEWNNVSGDDDRAKCAKIFLGCLPLYYQALTYIYWGCHDNGGRWRNLTLGGGALRSYFDSQGLFSPYVDTNKRGSHIVDSALKGFSEFRIAAISSATFTYASFNEKLQKNVTNESHQDLPSKCPLSALFHGASCYFRCQQITTTKSAVRAPKTIREVLYFLAALQFSSAYDELNNHIGTVLQQKLNVADSSLSTNGNTLSAADIKEYLGASCAFSSSVLGLIQGPGASEKDSEPWLFELFCNSAFHFKYPSGTALLSKVSNYAYALQFQLHFLYQQCNNTYTVGCGWRHCRFGKDVNSGSNNSAPSHICNGYTCKDPSKCRHNGTNNSTGGSSGPDSTSCKHNQGGYGSNCGKSGNLSPLQAFLTDKLKGFSRGHPSDPSSHLGSCSGGLCHVPMGFNPKDLRTASNANTKGENICLTLRAFCGGFNTPHTTF